MKPPARLFEDPEVSQYLRGSLAHYADQPVSYDLDKGAQSLALAIAALPPPDPNSPTGPGTFDLQGAGSLSSRAALSGGKVAWLKLVGAFMLASTIDAESDQLASNAVQARPAHVQSVPQQGAADIHDMSQQTLQAEQLAAPIPADSASQAVRKRNIEPAVSPLKREITQLRRIRQALPRDPATARRLAETSLKELPSGSLHQERMALAVIALFAVGESQRAQGEAADFLKRYPDSPLGDRIRKLQEDSDID